MKKEIELNVMQIAAVMANQRYKIPNITIEAGRGTSKSTVLGWFIKEGVRQMPRSTGVIVGETYVQIKSRTLPSTKEGLEMFGVYEGIDYVVGRSGVSMGFERPFQAPDSWNNVIHFRSRTIVVMVSLDNPNSGRGLNSYWVIGDEAALLTYERLFNNVLTTNRAKKAQFKGKSMLHAEIFVSSVAMTSKGEWFTKREELMMEEIRNKVPINQRKHIFIKASSVVNKNNLKDGRIEDMRKKALSKVLFDAEIMNPKGLLGEDLAKHLLPWYENRLTNFAYKWSFITKKNKIRKFNIRSEIFCYGKRHLIKSWTKKALSEDLYLVEIETETY